MAHKDIVVGIELYPTQMGAEDLANFSYQKCADGYEILMHFRGVRRFAFCTHENDAQVIVDVLNNKPDAMRKTIQKMAEALKCVLNDLDREPDAFEVSRETFEEIYKALEHAKPWLEGK